MDMIIGNTLVEATERNTRNVAASLTNPILLNGVSTCYKCNKRINVFAFSCKPYENNKKFEIPIFSNVMEVELLLENLINSTRIKKIFFKDYSNTTKDYYYMNHCQYCGAKRGEFFLHEEHSGPFFFQKDTKISELSYFKLNDNPNESFKIEGTVMIEKFESYPTFKNEKELPIL